MTTDAMPRPSLDVVCVPSEDRKIVTLTVSSPNEIGVHDLLRSLVAFIKHQLVTHGIHYTQVALHDADTIYELPLKSDMN